MKKIKNKIKNYYQINWAMEHLAWERSKPGFGIQKDNRYAYGWKFVSQLKKNWGVVGICLFGIHMLFNKITRKSYIAVNFPAWW